MMLCIKFDTWSRVFNDTEKKVLDDANCSERIEWKTSTKEEKPGWMISYGGIVILPHEAACGLEPFEVLA